MKPKDVLNSSVAARPHLAQEFQDDAVFSWLTEAYGKGLFR